MLYPGIEKTLTSLLQEELPKCEIRIARDPTAPALLVNAATRIGPQLFQSTTTIAYYALDSYTRKNDYMLRELALCVRRDMEHALAEHYLGKKGEKVALTNADTGTSGYTAAGHTHDAQTYSFPVIGEIKANYNQDFWGSPAGPAPAILPGAYIPGTVDYSRDLAKALDRQVQKAYAGILASKPKPEDLLERRDMKTVYEIYAVEIATEEVTGPYLITAKSREEAKIELFRQNLRGKVGDYALGFREVVCFEPKKEEK